MPAFRPLDAMYDVSAAIPFGNLFGSGSMRPVVALRELLQPSSMATISYPTLARPEDTKKSAAACSRSAFTPEPTQLRTRGPGARGAARGPVSTGGRWRTPSPRRNRANLCPPRRGRAPGAPAGQAAECAPALTTPGAPRRQRFRGRRRTAAPLHRRGVSRTGPASTGVLTSTCSGPLGACAAARCRERSRRGRPQAPPRWPQRAPRGRTFLATEGSARCANCD